MSTPTSYLQTLAKGDAIAFVTSLQKVKDHLSQELHWMTQQVQQKTIQLQGIETLLTEATQLGLVSSDTQPTAEAASTKAEDTSPSVTETLPDLPAVVASATNGTIASDSTTASTPPQLDSSVAASNGTVSPSPSDEETGEDTAPEPTADLSQPRPRRGRKPGGQSKTKQTEKTKRADKSSTKSSTTSKTSAANAKKARSTQAVEEDSSADLRRFLQPDFRDKTLAESLAELLDRAKEPVSINDLIAHMYAGLSDENYKRAKNSISNVLSVGRSKGKWQNAGRGLYASNAIATA